jgi:hypothetical protein
MNVFNRILAVVVLIFLFLLILALAVFPVELVRLAQRGLELTVGFLNTMETSYYVPYVISRIVLVLVALVFFGLLLWAEVWPRRPRAVRVHTETGSQALVTTDSVARRLAWHIDQLADVISVTPRVTAHGRSVDVVLDLQTSPEIDVPMKTDEVVAVAREVIVERMGMQVGKIEVHIEHGPYTEPA